MHSAAEATEGDDAKEGLEGDEEEGDCRVHLSRTSEADQRGGVEDGGDEDEDEAEVVKEVAG